MSRSTSVLFIAATLASLLLTLSATTTVSTVSKAQPNHHHQHPLRRSQTTPPRRTPPPSSLPPPSANNNITNRTVALSFLVAGYPKSGTTSLLYAFKRHNQTIFPSREVCGVSSKRGLDKVGRELKEAFATTTTTTTTTTTPGSSDSATTSSSSNDVTIAGVKCPQAISSPHGLQHLVEYSPELKLIVGLRHPVRLFESYYNYRITSMHDKGIQNFEAPPIESLIGAENSWKDVSTDTSRFELGLQQLGKVRLSKHQMKTLMSKHRVVAPVPFRVFLYTMEQIADHDKERSTKFGEDMQSFLGLSEPIVFTHENKNHFVGAKKHPETIDICEPRYDDLRQLLVSQGNTTQKWIKEKFLKSPDVSVGGSTHHFNELLSTWANDPCTLSSFEGVAM